LEVILKSDALRLKSRN